SLWESAPLEAPRAFFWKPLFARIVAWLSPRFARQQEFNAILVQLLNKQMEESARLQSHLRELVGACLRYFQRLLPLIDVRDRMATALATTRSDLILEAFDRRHESLARRIDGLLALRDRLEVVSEEIAAMQRPGAAQPVMTEAISQAATYAAFENRFRGSREEIRERLATYAESFAKLAPVVDLGCGRGEFLEILRAQGVAARGLELNAAFASECRERGLEVETADLIAGLKRMPTDSVGGIFASQVAEHLPPAVLAEMLSEARRVLRQDGLLILETVNPRSLIGFLEIYLRDLSHERALHPETLRFMAAAAGFTDVRIEWRAPVEPAARLQPVPVEGLPERGAATMNENIARLNDLIYAPQEYALFARR
ncbi:MAG: methionine biosynthesis protein MetW, partial [Vicinamibacteria bacterium]|nr:methionine biosynthesis protein MetW [Vicinamibacteria bacterium]